MIEIQYVLSNESTVFIIESGDSVSCLSRRPLRFAFTFRILLDHGFSEFFGRRFLKV